jgi:hypothetical protein
VAKKGTTPAAAERETTELVGAEQNTETNGETADSGGSAYEKRIAELEADLADSKNAAIEGEKKLAELEAAAKSGSPAGLAESIGELEAAVIALGEKAIRDLHPYEKPRLRKHLEFDPARTAAKPAARLAALSERVRALTGDLGSPVRTLY